MGHMGRNWTQQTERVGGKLHNKCAVNYSRAWPMSGHSPMRLSHPIYEIILWANCHIPHIFP